MMSILVPGEHMPFADHNSHVFTPPCSNAGCGCSSASQLIYTTTPTSWSAVTETPVNLRTKFTVSRSLCSPRTTQPRHGTLRCSVTHQHWTPTWLESKAYVDTHFQNQHHDPETRAMIIVTGNVSQVDGSHNYYGVHVDKNGMRVGCHFDAFASKWQLGSWLQDLPNVRAVHLDPQA